MALTRPRAYQIYDIDYKQAVRVVTISNITLSGGAPNSVDSVNLSLNDRILVTGQSSAVQNGIYYVTTVGTGANGTWTRSVDTDATGELLSGTIVMVTEGAIYADTQWKLTTDDPITIGVSALTFVQNYLANSISYGATSFAVGSTNANATISVAGTSNVAVYATTGEYITGLISATGNITGGNITTAGVISLAGNIYTGNILTNGYYYANGTAFAGGGGGGTPGGANTQIQYNNNGAFGGSAAFTFNNTTNAISTTGTFSATGNVSGGNIIQGGTRVIKWTTVANTAPTNAVAGDFWYNSYTGIKYQYTNDGTNNTWVDQSFPTVFSTLTTSQILNGGANGTGNIGSATTTFNTVFAKATSAQYADLAEVYTADEKYPPGTVVVFGGEKEITISTQSHDTRVAGVVSTNPAYLMNSESDGLPIAFTGRVPCLVQGPVNKGDVLVSSSVPGTAQRIGDNYRPGCVIGKSLETINDSTIKTIEVVVGRF